MTPEQHVAKARKILGAQSKLSAGDYEMTIEAAMLAGTHFLNAILHREGITAEDADVLHAEYMILAVRTRTQLSLPRLVECLDEIEQLRPFFVRGNIVNGENAALKALQLLARIREIGQIHALPSS
jgi:hypothetical protein